MKLRYKAATAQPDGYNILCPFKGCGYIFQVETASKGDIVKCPNCRKEMKIKKVG